jgi:hypothetical protein
VREGTDRGCRRRCQWLLSSIPLSHCSRIVQSKPNRKEGSFR